MWTKDTFPQNLARFSAFKGHGRDRPTAIRTDPRQPVRVGCLRQDFQKELRQPGDWGGRRGLPTKDCGDQVGGEGAGTSHKGLS